MLLYLGANVQQGLNVVPGVPSRCQLEMHVFVEEVCAASLPHVRHSGGHLLNGWVSKRKRSMIVTSWE